jgi:hypothetical protein
MLGFLESPKQPKTNQNIYEDDSKWCQCDEKDFDNSTFFDDGEHDELFKHHWRCSCNKILQIG